MFLYILGYVHKAFFFFLLLFKSAVWDKLNFTVTTKVTTYTHTLFLYSSKDSKITVLKAVWSEIMRSVLHLHTASGYIFTQGIISTYNILIIRL